MRPPSSPLIAIDTHNRGHLLRAAQGCPYRLGRAEALRPTRSPATWFKRGFPIGVKNPLHIRPTTTARPRGPLRDRAVAGFV